MPDYLNNSNKTTLLFKKFQNKTQTAIDDTTGGTSFFNEQKKSLNNIYNTDIFIENIEKNLPDEYKLSALDICGNIQGSIWNTSVSDQDYSNSSFLIPNTNLIFYKEIYLEPVSATNNAWWFIPPEFSDQITDNNLLKDMIPFNLNSISLSTFSPIVKYWNGTQWRTQSQNNTSGLNWLIDYASGILQFYQNDSILNSLNINCDSSGQTQRPRISFIKYVGAKGLENFSGGVGGGSGGSIIGGNVYNEEGEINFMANNENISKIKSTYDGNESSIKFSTINNSLLEDKLIINKDGINVVNGNITINEIIFTGSYNDLTNRPSLFTGSYNDLTNRPSLFSGSYNDLTNRPMLFSGSYNDLQNKPTIPTNNNQLTNGENYIKNGDTIHADRANYLHYFKDNIIYSLYLDYEHNNGTSSIYTRLKVRNSAENENSVHVRYADAATTAYKLQCGRVTVQDDTDNWNRSCLTFIDNITSVKLAHIFGSDIATPQHVYLNFTGQHRCFLNNNITNDYSGLIVSVKENYINIDNNIKPTINDSLPYCEITKKYKDSKVFGVLSEIEDNERTFENGNFVSLYEKTNVNENRFHINSIGEGSIWVCNYNGVINNGDYIVSSSIHGYGCKQDDDILHNYTVAKITCQCNFNLNLVSKKRVKTEKIITYIEEDVYKNISENTEKKRIIFNEELQRYIEESYIETTSKREKVYDEFDLYNENGNIIGKHKVTRKEIIEKEEQNIVYDEKGDVVFEDDLDENGNIQYEYEYDTRFLDENANILSGKEEYLSRLNNGENVYIACFVGCSYHCG